MKKYPPVHCRICGQAIDRNIERENIDWIMPSRNWFYHKGCYESWKQGTPKNDDGYIGFIYDFISRDLKVKYDFYMCEAQRRKFIAGNKMTNKGIFFTLKYFYEVKGGDWNKSHGGIGIVPFVYNEACTYWANREKNNKGLIEKIEQQMKEGRERKKKVIHKKTPKKQFKIDLSVIEEMENDE